MRGRARVGFVLVALLAPLAAAAQQPAGRSPEEEAAVARTASNAFAVGYGVMGSSELLLAPGRTAVDTTAGAPRADRSKKPE